MVEAHLQYAVGEITDSHEIVILRPLSKEEYVEYEEFKELATVLNAVTNIYKVLIGNGEEFLRYSASINALLQQGVTHEEAELEGNRLLINYLGAFGIFRAYGETENAEYLSKEKAKEFLDKTNAFYDDKESCNFIYALRTFAMEYGYPLNMFINRIDADDDYALYVKKQRLLKSSHWAHVKPFIDTLPDHIHLDAYVKSSMTIIETLYNYYISDIAPIIIAGLTRYARIFPETNKVFHKLLAIVVFEHEEDLQTGNVNLDFITPELFLDSVNIMRGHDGLALNGEIDALPYFN